jgi:hypothetical protein
MYSAVVGGEIPIESAGIASESKIMRNLGCGIDNLRLLGQCTIYRSAVVRGKIPTEMAEVPPKFHIRRNFGCETGNC